MDDSRKKWVQNIGDGNQQQLHKADQPEVTDEHHDLDWPLDRLAPYQQPARNRGKQGDGQQT